MVFKWFFKSHPLKSHPIKSHPHGTTTNSNNLGPIWETLLCMNPEPSAPQSSCHIYIPFAYERFWSPWLGTLGLMNPKPSARMNPKPSAHHEKPYSAWALRLFVPCIRILLLLVFVPCIRILLLLVVVPCMCDLLLLVVVPLGCDFKGCDLKGCDLKGFDLKGCDLKGCDFVFLIVFKWFVNGFLMVFQMVFKWSHLSLIHIWRCRRRG